MATTDPIASFLAKQTKSPTESKVTPSVGSEVAPSVGRIVRIKITTPGGREEVRPAIITHVNSDDSINLQVFVDGMKDYPDGRLSLWMERVPHGTWSYV